MSSPDLAALNAPFAEEELRTFTGRAGREFTYIEDETVMDRLDMAFGMGNWQVHVDPVPVYEGVVKVRLGVRVNDEAEWIWHEDFGYPSNTAGEALKEAVSDGIRRCGRYLGIARDLYRKDSPPVTRTAAVPPKPVANAHQDRPTPAPTPIRAARSSTDIPEEPDLGWDVLSKSKPEPFGATAVLDRDVDGTMTSKELFDRADSAKVPMDALAQASKKLFGAKAWKVKDLTDVQRYAVAIEVGLA